MKLGRIPVVPTILVLVAVAIMVALGFWQLQRLAEKEWLLALYANAQSSDEVREWPVDDGTTEPTFVNDISPVSYSRVRTECRRVLTQSTRAGRNADDQPGWAHVAECAVPEGERAEIVLGWSRSPNDVEWSGGWVTGTYLTFDEGNWRVVADPPVAGLVANAKPDPRDLPNNHLSYAVQWFLFALTALMIYGLALRRRYRERG